MYGFYITMSYAVTFAALAGLTALSFKQWQDAKRAVAQGSQE